MMDKIFKILVIVSLLASGIAFYKSVRQPKIAYIRSSELIYSYQGMKEAQQLFQTKKSKNQANVDTVRIELERAFNQFSREISLLNEKEKNERRALLRAQEENYLRYAQSIKDAEKKDEMEMTEGVLNQVNSFVEIYSKEHGYNLVMGTTNSGNLLYADEAMDITNDVLKAINEEYKEPVKESKN